MGAEALRQPLAKTRKSGLSHFFDTLKKPPFRAAFYSPLFCTLPGTAPCLLPVLARQHRSTGANSAYSRGEFWPSRHGTKESYASGGTPPQRNSAAVMSRGMVMAESSVVTATIRVLNR